MIQCSKSCPLPHCAKKTKNNLNLGIKTEFCHNWNRCNGICPSSWPCNAISSIQIQLQIQLIKSTNTIHHFPNHHSFPLITQADGKQKIVQLKQQQNTRIDCTNSVPSNKTTSLSTQISLLRRQESFILIYVRH